LDELSSEFERLPEFLSQRSVYNKHIHIESKTIESISVGHSPGGKEVWPPNDGFYVRVPVKDGAFIFEPYFPDSVASDMILSGKCYSGILLGNFQVKSTQFIVFVVEDNGDYAERMGIFKFDYTRVTIEYNTDYMGKDKNRVAKREKISQ